MEQSRLSSHVQMFHADHLPVNVVQHDSGDSEDPEF